MNPSTALATVLVDELARVGVRDVVLCPGSRSAPLAYALQQADRVGRLRLHVRVDERSAAFLALGLGKATGRPAVVVTTSGTAVANLHPAVLESAEAGVPLLVLTADRPPELRGTRANQTTDQVKLFGSAVRWFHGIGTPDRRPGQQAAWRTTVDRAYAAAVGAIDGDPGPVHLNLPMREPLAPDLATADLADDAPADGDPADGGPAGVRSGLSDALDWPEPLHGRADGSPWTIPPQPAAGLRDRIGEAATSGSGSSGPAAAAAFDLIEVDPVPRTLLVLGDVPYPALAAQAIGTARHHGWPVLAEPFGRRLPGQLLPHGPVLAAAVPSVPALWPERIVVVGRLTLSRDVAALLRLPGVQIDLVTAQPGWADPGHLVHRVHRWQPSVASAAPTPTGLPQPADAGPGHPTDAGPGRPADGSAGPAPDWGQRWQHAAAVVAGVVGPALTRWWPSGPAVAAALLDSAPDGSCLFVGSSTAVRDVDLARTVDPVTVSASRGLAGIDGCVATAVGMALGRPDRPSYALLGDLSLLHDANGLLIGPGEPRPDLTVVVVNDDGGGIFALLEYGEPERAADFERVFGTPTGARVADLCRAFRVDHRLVSNRQELQRLVARRPDGLSVLEVAVDRSTHRTRHQQLHRQVTAALQAAIR